ERFFPRRWLCARRESGLQSESFLRGKIPPSARRRPPQPFPQAFRALVSHLLPALAELARFSAFRRRPACTCALSSQRDRSLRETRVHFRPALAAEPRYVQTHAPA